MAQLFVNDPFVSHSGLALPFKIDCDALSREDLATLAGIVSGRLRFRHVHGVPRGGLRFAAALAPYITEDGASLIVDDVLTTGASMEAARVDLSWCNEIVGIVIFARGPCPSWVTPIFSLCEAWGTAPSKER
jgi:hypothetical protein